MTGIDFGFGTLVAYSLLFLLLVPSLTILLINKIDYFGKSKNSTKNIFNIIFFILFGYFTLLIIRKFHTVSFKFLLSYIILITFITFLLGIRKSSLLKLRKKRNNE